MSTTITLPDLLKLSNWIFPVEINPNYEDVRAETIAYIESFQAYDQRTREISKKCMAPLAMAMGLPAVSKEYLRLITDLMEWLVLLDERINILETRSAKELVLLLTGILKLIIYKLVISFGI